MNRETYEKQKAFAGEKKPSMLRRCIDHDYTVRQMYLITMVTEGRKPLLGQVIGRSDAPFGTVDAPQVQLTALGQRVKENWYSISLRYPQIKVVSLQMMPDHFHGILFVQSQLEKPLGKVLLGFKQGCNKAYRELVLGIPSVQYVAVLQQQTGQEGQREEQERQREGQEGQIKQGKDDRSHGLLFARGYNDRLLLREGQLDIWLNYLADNPRRLLMKREHPDLFRVQRGLMVGEQQFSAIGNRFLLSRPLRLQVQCSRRLTEAEVQAKVQTYLAAARQGAVLVSPAISPGEKAVMRAAFDEGLPLIYLKKNGFSELAKPGGKRMEACANGQLLILAPWSHHNEQISIRRDQCLMLNQMAELICKNENSQTVNTSIIK